MAKAEYAVVGGTTRKIKKEYAVIGNQTRKIKKKYVVVDGKTWLCWSGNELKLVSHSKPNTNRSHAQLFSADCSEWQESASEFVGQVKGIINVDGALFCLSELYYSNYQYSWYLYKSTDGGVTWTQVTRREGYSGGYILRYLNDHLVVIGKYNSASITMDNSYWYSNDLGVTWTAKRYSVPSTTPSGSTIDIPSDSAPLDIRYGTVGNKTGYYMLLNRYNSFYTYILYFQDKSLTYPSFVGGSYYNTFTSLWERGALSIRDGKLCMVGGVSGSNFSRLIFSYTSDISGNFTNNILQDSSPTARVLTTVASNSDYMVVTAGYDGLSYKFDGTNATEGGSIGSQEISYCGTFASTFVDATRVVACKATINTSTYIAYSDNYGASWTVVPVGALDNYCNAICSIDPTDNYY